MYVTLVVLALFQLEAAAETSVFEDSSIFPRVDLRQPLDEIVLALRQAADKGGPGFFYLTNHGIPESVFDDAIRESHRFFSLPMRKKLEINSVGYGGGTKVSKGYTPPFSEGSYTKDATDVRPSDEEASGKRNLRESYVFRFPEQEAIANEKYFSNYTAFLHDVERNSDRGARNGLADDAPQARLSHPSNRVGSVDEVHAAALRFHLKNQWPSPFDLVSLRPAYERYFSEMLQLSHKMFDFFSRAMGPSMNTHLKNGDDTAVFPSIPHDKSMVTFNMVHYPIMNASAGDFGIVDHTDWEAFTLLYPTYLLSKHVDGCSAAVDRPRECATLSSQTGIYHTGLEVWYQDKWMAVPRIPGAILVNQGEMLSRLSDGKFKAPVHRVLAHSDSPRYSLISFWAPDYEFLLPDPEAPCGKVLVGEHYLRRNAMI